MKKERFPFTSDQMELLLAFEKAGSLEGLSDLMAKDPSVVSRRLQALAQITPVLEKVSGRWKITFLGRQVNELSVRFLEDLQKMTASKGPQKNREILPAGTPLVIINAQKALHYSGQGRRNNLQAEDNILKLLKVWRKNSWPVIHVKHTSLKQGSLFHKDSPESDFIDDLAPIEKELVLQKLKSSAFTNTELESILRKKKVSQLVIVGFTAGECIDATARQARDLDFDVFVVGDATATFDILAANGRLVKAEKVHHSVLTNLHANAVTVVDTKSIT